MSNNRFAAMNGSSQNTTSPGKNKKPSSDLTQKLLGMYPSLPEFIFLDNNQIIEESKAGPIVEAPSVYN